MTCGRWLIHGCTAIRSAQTTAILEIACCWAFPNASFAACISSSSWSTDYHSDIGIGMIDPVQGPFHGLDVGSMKYSHQSAWWRYSDQIKVGLRKGRTPRENQLAQVYIRAYILVQFWTFKKNREIYSWFDHWIVRIASNRSVYGIPRPDERNLKRVKRAKDSWDDGKHSLPCLCQ
jgi:hypothetical protein